MDKYRKKPVEISAVQWTGENLDRVLDFCEGAATYEAMSSGGGMLVLETLESNKEAKTRHAATVGDWIIRGVKGEFYACKPDIFAMTYEPAQPAPGGDEAATVENCPECGFPSARRNGKFRCGTADCNYVEPAPGGQGAERAKERLERARTAGEIAGTAEGLADSLKMDKDFPLSDTLAYLGEIATLARSMYAPPPPLVSEGPKDQEDGAA